MSALRGEAPQHLQRTWTAMQSPPNLLVTPDGPLPEILTHSNRTFLILPSPTPPPTFGRGSSPSNNLPQYPIHRL